MELTKTDSIGLGIKSSNLSFTLETIKIRLKESLRETLKMKTTAEITELMDMLTKEQINVEATFDNDFFTGEFLTI